MDIGEIPLSNGQRLVGYVENCGATTSTRAYVVVLDEGEDISSFGAEAVIIVDGYSIKIEKISNLSYKIGYAGAEVEWKTNIIGDYKFVFSPERMEPYQVEIVPSTDSTQILQ